ncbi:MAG: hypothetical protein PHO23_03265 [Candidatus Pacebacteria bacterium]|nr:hypothetical protein [Candidatus Paceibacterota bacterium]
MSIKKAEKLLVAKQGDTISLLNLFQGNFDCEELKKNCPKRKF